MKLKPNSKFGSIRGRIIFGKLLLKNVVKLVEVFDTKLKKRGYRWITGDTFEFFRLKPGVYGIKLTFTTGATHYETTEVFPQQISDVEFSLDNELIFQYEDWLHIEKVDYEGYMVSYSEGIELTDFKFNLKLVSYDGYDWTSRFLQEFSLGTAWSEDANFTFNTGSGMQFLMLEHDRYDAKYVRLPPDSTMFFNYRAGFTSQENVLPIDIKLTTDNWQAEGLLELLQSGAIQKAKTLINAEDAEQLLYSKRQDHSAAAVGGYYLLKTRELDRIHNWAANLCNWFPELPDGAIIYAWQLISSGRDEPSTVSVIQVRELLIKALGRGLPVYTEGLRLLYEGLKQLHLLAGKNDAEIEVALEVASFYYARTDKSQGLTTLNNIYSKVRDFDFNEYKRHHPDNQRAIDMLTSLIFKNTPYYYDR